MSRWPAIVIAVVGACSSDPSLAVSVTEHEPYASAVHLTVVTGYAGADLTCDQIKFGDITDVDLVALVVSETSFDDAKTNGGTLTLDRLGGKSIVARGFDDKHRLVLAGCQDIGEIVAGSTVTIDTQPAIVAAIDPGIADLPFAMRTIGVTTADISNKLLDTQVSWILYGPGGSADTQPAQPITTTAGLAAITVTDLTVPGPEALRIRIPWLTAQPPLITAFSLAGAQMVSLGGIDPIVEPACAIRGRGHDTSSLVCLNKANGISQSRDVVEITWATDHWATATLQNNIPHAVWLFVDHDGNLNGETIYVVANDGKWFNVPNPVGIAVTLPPSARNLIYVPSCNVGESPFVAVAGSTVSFYQVGGTAIPVASPPSAMLDGGCISVTDGTHQRAIVAVAATDPDFSLFPINNSSIATAAVGSTKFSGAGFINVNGELQFAGTRFGATGTVVVQDVLARIGNTYDLVERREVEAAAPPTRIAAGHLDNDADTDLVWDMDLGTTHKLFQVSLAKTIINNVPLSAITSGGPTLRQAALQGTGFVVGNLNGTGGDEVALFSSGNVVIVSPDP